MGAQQRKREEGALSLSQEGKEKKGKSPSSVIALTLSGPCGDLLSTPFNDGSRGECPLTAMCG
jgi:hypothetical protein